MHCAPTSVYPTLQKHSEPFPLPTEELEKFLQSWHTEAEVAPKISEYFPAVHKSHSEVPLMAEKFVSLYLPAWQAVQSSPPEPEYPLLHVHFVLALLSGNDVEIKLQLKQSVAACVGEYLPDLCSSTL